MAPQALHHAAKLLRVYPTGVVLVVDGERAPQLFLSRLWQRHRAAGRARRGGWRAANLLPLALALVRAGTHLAVAVYVKARYALEGIDAFLQPASKRQAHTTRRRGLAGGGRVGSSIGTSPQPAASCRLWDRATDAAQTVNVFGEHPAVVHSLIAALHRHVLRMSDALAENVDGKSGAAGGAPRCRDGAVVDCTQAARAVQYSLGFIFAPESLMCHSWYRSLVSATLEALEAPHDAEKPAVKPSPSSPLLCPLRWRNSWGAATSEEQAKRALKRSATSAHFKSSNRASKLAFARLSGRWLNTANLGDMDALMERLGVGSLKRKALAARNWGVGKIGQVIHVECACSLQANRTRVLILATRLSKALLRTRRSLLNGV